MKQEEKDLLLKDLCAKLPYGVKVCARFNTGSRYTANVTAICADRDYIQIRQNVLHPYTNSSIEDIRLYLRPMSTMTEDEEDELNSARMGNYGEDVDWLNAYHFDYRIDPLTGKTLIESGLALKAPEGMYV